MRRSTTNAIQSCLSGYPQTIKEICTSSGFSQRTVRRLLVRRYIDGHVRIQYGRIDHTHRKVEHYSLSLA